MQLQQLANAADVADVCLDVVLRHGRPPQDRIYACAGALKGLAVGVDGRLLGGWGGSGVGYDWPKNERGIHVDKHDNVWLAGNDKDDQILKFTQDGRFVLQIGKAETPGGPNSTTRRGRPAHRVTDDDANELYVANGYGSRRIIVFDATTGAYKRLGCLRRKTRRPMTSYLRTSRWPGTNCQSRFPIPCTASGFRATELVYVCDRANDRIQIFKKDGSFVKEFQLEPQTLQNGSVWDLVLSEDRQQRYIFVADGADMQVVTIDRQTGGKLGSFGRPGDMADNFKWVHNIAINSRGTIYTAEVGDGRRVQKFRRTN
jgi:DNA-binding beta-propeller fold protein YncE